LKTPPDPAGSGGVLLFGSSILTLIGTLIFQRAMLKKSKETKTREEVKK
jgi:hypothetical protein